MALGIGADADVGFAWSGRRRWCRRRSSAASYRVIGNDRQILQYRQWFWHVLRAYQTDTLNDTANNQNPAEKKNQGD